MTGSAYGLTSPRPADWRSTAACRTEDPNLFFPAATTGPDLLITEQAKAVCRRCPIVERCLQWAMDDRIDYGVFGGLTEKERVSLRRSATRRRLTPQKVAEKARQPQQPRTLSSIVDGGTTRLFGGHLAWTGSLKVHFQGGTYTPRQAVFLLDRGRKPSGPVRTECGTEGCVLPAHITDTDERGECGTRPGYQRHLREGTEICPPCRQANTDADNQLRRTGTTKKAAA